MRAFLVDRLARHEVPNRVVVADLPRNAAGTVDKRRLREQLAGPHSAIAVAPGAPPTTAAETMLAEVWEDVLGPDPLNGCDRRRPR